MNPPPCLGAATCFTWNGSRAPVRLAARARTTHSFARSPVRPCATRARTPVRSVMQWLDGQAGRGCPNCRARCDRDPVLLCGLFSAEPKAGSSDARFRERLRTALEENRKAKLDLKQLCDLTERLSAQLVLANATAAARTQGEADAKLVLAENSARLARMHAQLEAAEQARQAAETERESLRANLAAVHQVANTTPLASSEALDATLAQLQAAAAAGQSPLELAHALCRRVADEAAAVRRKAAQAHSRQHAAEAALAQAREQLQALQARYDACERAAALLSRRIAETGTTPRPLPIDESAAQRSPAVAAAAAGATTTAAPTVVYAGPVLGAAHARPPQLGSLLARKRSHDGAADVPLPPRTGELLLHGYNKLGLRTSALPVPGASGVASRYKAKRTASTPDIASFFS